MNREQILNYIKSPDKLDKESLPQLKDLVSQFPYCQTAQLLLVRNLHNEGNIQYTSQLKIAAAYASDRKVLYHLINKEPLIRPLVESKPYELATLAPEAPVSQPVRPESEPYKPERKDSISLPAAQVPEEKTTSPQAVSTAEAKEKLSPMEILQRRLKEIEESKRLNEKPEEGSGKQTDIEPFPPVQELAAVAVSAPPVADPSPQETQAPAEVTKTHPRSRDKKSGITTPLPKVEPEEETESNEVHTFTEWLKLKKPSTAPKKHPKVKQQIDIIEKFIREEPRISQPKKEFFNPANMARMSLHEYDDLITETLAKIYFDQGSYQKALSAYEKLILLHPEKSSTFAAQIKAIKKIISQK